MGSEDSSGSWKSVYALPCLPSARAWGYVCRMTDGQRVVIVTGASRGIGAGLVAGYRSLGFGVVATSRSIAPSKDDQVLTIAGDIRNRATAQKVAAAAKERFGRVDTLVNNAGIFVAKPFIEYTEEDFDVVTGTNVAGLFHITQIVLAELDRRAQAVAMRATRKNRTNFRGLAGCGLPYRFRVRHFLGGTFTNLSVMRSLSPIARYLSRSLSPSRKVGGSVQTPSG